ncbi:hypothetical protein EFK50_09755 [Nocardioides marmoriginsengisoli]|uniref:SsuA/THI5-like domain-containing protein n=1 Tax=Nocardioides marmoriginsengisoli TaxID=661483 RepID=A0A3N0CF55_9ACTN|nr:ABC transporter substrate-binding protein [Nocardioides marmoriginsengisoli]RNL62090.1 hypothetical protein EFK50_09755 [Nocardioides marmoriginsengisoli]
MRRNRLVLGVSALSVLAVTAAGCGSDSTSDADGAEFEIKPVAGCTTGWTDPADLSPTRKAARCDAGAPAPQPLEKSTKLTIAITNKSAELIAPLVWGQKHGEFEKENLTLDIKVIPPADALNLLASEKIDAWLSSPDASFHNALSQDYDLKWVSGNYFESSESKSGLWAKAENATKLDGASVGSAAGPGSVIMLPIATALEEAGVSIKDVKVQQLPSADQITALQNGGTDASWLLTPTWAQVADDPAYTFIGGQPAGEPLGGFIYGKELLKENPDVGRALLRAYIRTVNTTFSGDYKKDPALVAELAELLEVPAETLSASPSLIIDWEIRKGTSERLQEIWHDLDALSYDDTIPESEVVDRSFYEAAVGHQGS